MRPREIVARAGFAMFAVVSPQKKEPTLDKEDTAREEDTPALNLQQARGAQLDCWLGTPAAASY